MAVNKNPKTGKYYFSVRYTDWQGNQKRKKQEGFRREKDAKEAERKFLNKMAADVTMTFENLCEYYMEDQKNRIKPTTYRNQQLMIKRHFIPVFGKIPINKIEPVTIRNWQNRILAHNYTATYQRMMHARLSAIFNYAVNFYNLSRNPVKLAGSIGKSNSNRIDFWTLDEFKRFMDVLTRKTDFERQHIHRIGSTELYALCFNMLFYTGMREGELLALTPQDIDLSKHTVCINKSYARLHGQDLIQTPKTEKSNRTIPLPLKLCIMIQKYYDSLCDVSPTDRIFSVLNKHGIAQALETTAKIAGIKRIRIHDLRHSHASLLINMGFSPLQIADRLGHDKVKTTLDTYSHLYPHKNEEVANKLDAII